MRVAPPRDGVMYPSGTARSNVSSRELAVIAQKAARLFSKEKVVSSILTHCSRSAGPNQQMDPEGKPPGQRMFATQVDLIMRLWSSGKTADSKPANPGSIPGGRAGYLQVSQVTV